MQLWFISTPSSHKTANRRHTAPRGSVGSLCEVRWESKEGRDRNSFGARIPATSLLIPPVEGGTGLELGWRWDF